MTAFDVFPRDFSMQLAAENLQLIFQRSAPLKTKMLKQVHDGLLQLSSRKICYRSKGSAKNR